MKKFIKHFVLSYISIVLFLIAYTMIVLIFIHSWGMVEPNTFLFIGVIPFFSLFISLYRHDFNPKTKKIIILVFIVITLIYFIPKKIQVPNSIEKQGSFGIYDNEKQEFIYPSEYKEDICFGLHFSKTYQNANGANHTCFGFVKTTIVPIINNNENG